MANLDLNTPVVPYLRNWSANDVVTSAALNSQVRDMVDFLTSRKPHASMNVRTTTVSIPDNTWTTVPLDTVVVDTHGGFSSSGAYTAQLSGWYQCMAGVAWVADQAFDRAIRFNINNYPSVSGICSSDSAAGVLTGLTISRMIPLVAGQVLRVQGWNNAGHAVSTDPQNSFLDIAFFSQFYGYTA